MTSLQDVLTYITTQATTEDYDRIAAACNQRNKVLHAEAAAQTIAELNPGDEVETFAVRPKYLSGLTGKFLSLDNSHKGKTLAVVKLDRVSVLQAGPRYVNPANDTIKVPASSVRRVVNA